MRARRAFVVAEASSFSLAPVFCAAVSIFDSLNHILTVPDLNRAFRNINDALKTGALFVSDMRWKMLTEGSGMTRTP